MRRIHVLNLITEQPSVVLGAEREISVPWTYEFTCSTTVDQLTNTDQSDSKRCSADQHRPIRLEEMISWPTQTKVLPSISWLTQTNQTQRDDQLTNTDLSDSKRWSADQHRPIRLKEMISWPTQTNQTRRNNQLTNTDQSDSKRWSLISEPTQTNQTRRDDQLTNTDQSDSKRWSADQHRPIKLEEMISWPTQTNQTRRGIK
jgi:hypothetical protein